MVSLWRRRDSFEVPALFLTLLWVGCFWVLGVVFFVTARFRIPAVPMLMIPAGWSLVEIALAVRTFRWRSLGSHAAVIVTAGVLVWPMWFGRAQSGWAGDYVNLGNAMHSAGDLGRAEKTYRRALALGDEPDAHYLLARVLLSRKKGVRALQHLESARRILPTSPDVLLTLARAQVAARNPQRARKLLNQVVNSSKDCNLWPRRAEWVTAHIMLADLEPSKAEEHWEQAWSIHPATAAEASFLRRKDMPRVLETFRLEAENKPWDWYAQANYGLALLETSRPGQAVIPLRLAAKLAPKKDVIHFQLARALAETGKKNEAVIILEKLLQALPNSVLRRDVKALHGRLITSGD